jgi:ribosomal protein L32
MSVLNEKQLPLAVFAADNEGRLRFRLPLVTYTNRYEAGASTVWMSPQVEAVTGYRADEWVGKPGFFERILHPDDRMPVLEEMRVSRDRFRPFSRDYRLQARNGEIVWIHDESIPVLDAAGEPEFIQGYFVDITERKRFEEALRHAHKVEAVGRLAGGIAHDFNNLLTAISGYAALTEQQLPRGHGAQRYLREIGRTVQRAVRLTRQLLAFSRRQELDPQVFDLGGVVREMESMLHVAGNGVQVDFDLCESALVYADIGELEQVLMNLVANARRRHPCARLRPVLHRRRSVGRERASVSRWCRGSCGRAAARSKCRARRAPEARFASSCPSPPSARLPRSMAVPKRKTSKARRDQRRAQHKIDPPRVSTCPQCGSPKRSHHICPTCGTYKGREIEPLRFQAR